MDKKGKVFIAGRYGMVGSAMERVLRANGYDNIIGVSSKELDLRNQENVKAYFEKERPQYVILAAAKVGGIAANMAAPAEFLYDNLAIQNNIIHSAYQCNVDKLLFLASSCIYPRDSIQPMKEEYLLSGKLEPTNEGYAIAKIAGIKLCEYYNKQYGTNFISVMPCNLYGPNDCFDLEKAHVVPALIRRFHEAKENNSSEIKIWGTGNARRELMYVDDMAAASLHIFETYCGNEFINIGTGTDCSIKDLVKLIADIIGYEGNILFDSSKPDGMPQKLLDVSRLNDMGWENKVTLEEGIRRTYNYYKGII